jgi:nucleoside phosphorylase
MEKILICCATDREFDILEEFISKEHYNNVEIMQTGVGKVLTSIRLTEKVLKNKYEHNKIVRIINFGLAGNSVSPNYIGEILQIGKIVDIDYDTSAFDGPEGKHKLYNTDNNTLYTCYCSDKLTTTKYKMLDGTFDMESSAIAEISYYFDIKLCMLKYISDYIDEKYDKNQYMNFVIDKEKVFKVLRSKI